VIDVWNFKEVKSWKDSRRKNSFLNLKRQKGRGDIS